SPKAKPRASAIPMGKKKTQKMTSGSRTNSSRRDRMSSKSGLYRRGLVIAQPPSGQREKDVLQRGPPCRELLELGPGAVQRREQRGDRFGQRGDADGPVVLPLARVEGARDRGDELERGRRVRGELQDVRCVEPADELRRRAFRDHLAVVHD